MSTLSSVANANNVKPEFQIVFANLDCVWFSWVSLCVPYIDLVMISIMVLVLLGAAVVLSQSSESSNVKKDTKVTKELCETNRTETTHERYSTQLVFPTDESRMTRISSEPNLQSIIEPESEDGAERVEETKKSRRLSRVSSIPDFKKLKETIIPKVNRFSSQSRFHNFDPFNTANTWPRNRKANNWSLNEASQPDFGVTSQVVAKLWETGTKKINHQRNDIGLEPNKYATIPSMPNFGSYSSFFSSPLINNDTPWPEKIEKSKLSQDACLEKTPSKLNPQACEFSPSKINNVFPGDTEEYEHCPYVDFSSGLEVEQANILCKFGEKCAVTSCPFSHGVTDDISIQLVADPNSTTPTDVLPVVPLNFFPEHTQRLIALGLFNERPENPKYTISVIPNALKKKRRKRKNTKKRFRNFFPVETCNEEEVELVRGLIKNLNCLNENDTALSDTLSEAESECFAQASTVDL